MTSDTTIATKPTWRTRLEMIAVTFGLVWSIAYPLISPYPATDLEIFINTATGRVSYGFYYAPWAIPFFRALDAVPLSVAAAFVNTLSFLGFLYAINPFRGDKILFFISYPFLMMVHYGQMEGVYAFGLAVMVVSLRRKNDLVASIGALLAITKFYIGIPLVAGIWLIYARDHWSRARVALFILLGGLFSLIVWQGWVGDLVAASIARPPNAKLSIDLWRIFGAWVLVLWIPPLLLAHRQRDFMWWTATWVLTVPYLYARSLTFLLLHPVGWIGWGVQVNYVTGFVLSTFLQIIPTVIYARGLIRAVRRRDRSHPLTVSSFR